MTNNWYEIVSSEKPLTQGDLIFDCPVLVWKNDIPSLDEKDEVKILKSSVECLYEDVIVMTQACDLEHNKVKNITLCKHVSISDYRVAWEARLRSLNQFPKTAKKLEDAFKKQFKQLKDGYVWNMSLLNNFENKEINFEHRIVDFYHVYTIPKLFLEGLLEKREITRPQLVPPYREHLSQSFARFYMRVGLPTPINNIPE